MTTFTTPGHAAVRISLQSGEIRVEAADVDTVDVSLTPLRDDDATHQAIASARVEMHERAGGHEIVVDVPKRSGFVLGRGPRVAIRVRCPVGADLGVRTGSADLVATGPLGAVEVKTASGDVSLEDVASLRVDGASSDVLVRDVAGVSEIRTASGDVTVRSSGGVLRAGLVSGDLLVGHASAELSVTTVSGDVRVEAAGGGHMRIQAVSGDVHLGIRPGERLYLDATSVSGTMSSDLGLDDVPPVDDVTPVIEVRVQTVSGDVGIVRASPVGA